MSHCGSCGRRIEDSSGSCPYCGGTAIPERVARGLQTLFKPGQTLAGRYRVRSVLGTGASGVVYGVFDTLSERNQALKVLWDGASGDDPELKRLRREIRASQLAPCSRLVAIHDLVMIGERPALVMEWVEGETLREKIKREGPLSWREAAAAAAGILEGLAHLHGLGIVHRDVKTGNILLGPDGGVKVGDFGLAKGGDLGASLTQPGAALGTPGYMAPEVIRGKPATSRSDLYSVGVVLFEMLTGLLPHRGTSALEIASRQLADPPPLHLLKERNVPRWLARIVARLLERDPGDRFPSAKTTLAALNERSAGFSVARRWRRRSAAAAAVLLALGGLLAAYFWFTAQAPLDLTFHGRTLQAHSPSGRLLWSRKLPRDIQSALYGRFGPGGTPAVAAAITWDRHAATMEVAPDQGNVLYLLDRHGKTLDSVGMGLANSPFEPHYDIHLTQHRFSADGPERLVAVLNHNIWFPAGIQVLNFKQRSGPAVNWRCQFLCNLYNSGNISHVSYADLDGDGRDDIIYTGVNNRLYWADFVAAVPLEPHPFLASSRVVSPDLTAASGERPIFYRCFSFRDFRNLRISDKAPPPARFSLFFLNGPSYFLLPDGRLKGPGPMISPPSPATLRTLNKGLADLCKWRHLEKWSRLLGAAGHWSRRASGPYRWIGLLFQVESCMGLGRYSKARSLLAPYLSNAGSSEVPAYCYQYFLDSEFLEGRYGQCLAEVSAMPASIRMSRVELADTAAWAALYLGDSDSADRYISGPVLSKEDWAPDLYSGIESFVNGQFSEAEATFKGTFETFGARFPTPGLWLLRTLVREGKLKQARALLDKLTEIFPSQHLNDSEPALWLRWREGDRSAMLVNQFGALAAHQRREAKRNITARALLPFTLAHQAAVLRAAGDSARATKIQHDADRLAPKSWRPLLQ